MNCEARAAPHGERDTFTLSPFPGLKIQGADGYQRGSAAQQGLGVLPGRVTLAAQHPGQFRHPRLSLNQ
jgi:hypothetical protein